MTTQEVGPIEPCRHLAKEGARKGVRADLLCAAVVLTLTIVISGPAGATAADRHDRAGLVDFAGIRVQQVTRVDSRLLDVTMLTAALAAPVHVDVLLPS